MKNALLQCAPRLLAALLLCLAAAGCSVSDGPPDPKIAKQLVGAWEGPGQDGGTLRLTFRADGTLRQVVRKDGQELSADLTYLLNTAHEPIRLDFLGPRLGQIQTLLCGIVRFESPDLLLLRTVPLGVPRPDGFDEKHTSRLARVVEGEHAEQVDGER
ncbi:MAG: hypothetical protein M5U26_06175 [Planctomycetota bacterium]|nr:hypothetical protein [Planctomycetota bacterium]